MTVDRGEWTGVGAAVLFHLALIAALSTGLATINARPEPPTMDVELVDEIGLTSAAPTPIPQPTASEPPPAPSEDIRSPVEEATPTPPQPRAVPTPTARPAPEAPRPQTRPAPTRTERPAPRQGIGDDFLERLGPSEPARPAAPAYDAQARASISQSIAQQAQRCADREPFVGEGADRVRLTVQLNFARSGRLSRPPRITGMSGDPELRAKYGELLEDQVRRIFADCAPFRLPPELYDTADGGWRETTLIYRVRR